MASERLDQVRPSERIQGLFCSGTGDIFSFNHTADAKGVHQTLFK